MSRENFRIFERGLQVFRRGDLDPASEALPDWQAGR